MSSRKLIIVIVTIAVAVAAWKITLQKAPETEFIADRLYPELFDRINDAARISIKTVENETDLVRIDNQWVVENLDNFPSEFATVKSTLLRLAEVIVIEQKTSKPEFYQKIGVAGTEQQGSNSMLLVVEDVNGDKLVQILIGNERSGNNLDTPNYYVRKAHGAVALLVEGNLGFDDEPSKWVDTDIVNIAAKRVQKVTVNRPDEKIIVASKKSHTDSVLSLEDIPPGFVSVSRASVSAYGGLLLNLKFEDVAAAAKVDGLTPKAVTEVQTFDGLVASLEQFEIGENEYMRFRFAFDPDIVIAPQVVPDAVAATLDSLNKKNDPSSAEKPEEVSVEDEKNLLNAKVSNWIYQIPSYKVRLLNKTFDELIKPEDKEKIADET
ncbi:MAG TPA: hypothetical protein DGR97_13080 [Gammaproteobacteria bacterium]|nr:hypothetical protein [Gammaproteobacteria bacterium]|tara:strand:+ start:224 stop:1363 length:1140 start_codon:yes stop_codon:yes gene_type:complete